MQIDLSNVATSALVTVAFVLFTYFVITDIQENAEDYTNMITAYRRYINEFITEISEILIRSNYSYDWLVCIHDLLVHLSNSNQEIVMIFFAAAPVLFPTTSVNAESMPELFNLMTNQMVFDEILNSIERMLTSLEAPNTK